MKLKIEVLSLEQGEQMMVLNLFGLIIVLIGMQQHLLEETSMTSFSLVEIELVLVILETLVTLKEWGQS